MKKIRKAMFETNSSSCHSIIIDLGPYIKHKVSRAGRLLVNLGYYGDDKIISSPKEKIDWLFTMLFTICEGNCYSKSDFDDDLENFTDSRKYEIQKIQACIEEIEGPIFIEYRMVPGDGIGMNHELHNEWYSLDDYLKEVGVSLKDFIYSDRVKVKIYHD